MANIPQTRRDINAANQIIDLQDQILGYDWADMAWAAITVGRRSFRDVFAFQAHSLMEIIWRYSIIRANLAIKPHWKGGDRFVASEAFKALDGSEKAAVSYFYGPVLSKLAAEHQLQVPWLLHLDVYAKINAYSSQPPIVATMVSSSRPDLVGLARNGNWLVCEAKGRSGSITNENRIKAKEQTRQISTINGAAPQWRYASFARFTGSEMALAHEWIDPSGAAESAIPLTLPIEDFMRSYYAPIVEILSSNRDRSVQHKNSGRTFIVRHVPDLGLTIGIDREHPVGRFLERYLYDDPQMLGDVYPRQMLVIEEEFSSYQAPAKVPGVKVGNDGVFIAISEKQ